MPRKNNEKITGVFHRKPAGNCKMVFIVEHRQYAAETIRIMIVAVALVPWCRIDAKIEITTGMNRLNRLSQQKNVGWAQPVLVWHLINSLTI